MKARYAIAIASLGLLLGARVNAGEPLPTKGRKVLGMPPREATAPEPMRLRMERKIEIERWTGEHTSRSETEMTLQDAEGRQRHEYPNGVVELRMPGKPQPITLFPDRRSFVDGNAPQVQTLDPKFLKELRKAEARGDFQGATAATPQMSEIDVQVTEQVDLPDQEIEGRPALGKRMAWKSIGGLGPDETSREVWRDKASGRVLRVTERYHFPAEMRFGNREHPIKVQTVTTDHFYMDTRSMDPKLFEIPKNYREAKSY